MRFWSDVIGKEKNAVSRERFEQQEAYRFDGGLQDEFLVDQDSDIAAGKYGFLRFVLRPSTLHARG